jgi:hypothetical protein
MTDQDRQDNTDNAQADGSEQQTGELSNDQVSNTTLPVDEQTVGGDEGDER